MTATSPSSVIPGRQRTEIVDVDVHERAALEELVPYLEPQWRRYITEFGWQPERLLPYAQPCSGRFAPASLGRRHRDAKVRTRQRREAT